MSRALESLCGLAVAWSRIGAVPVVVAAVVAVAAVAAGFALLAVTS